MNKDLTENKLVLQEQKKDAPRGIFKVQVLNYHSLTFNNLPVTFWPLIVKT